MGYSGGAEKELMMMLMTADDMRSQIKKKNMMN